MPISVKFPMLRYPISNLHSGLVFLRLASWRFCDRFGSKLVAAWLFAASGKRWMLLLLALASNDQAGYMTVSDSERLGLEIGSPPMHVPLSPSVTIVASVPS